MAKAKISRSTKSNQQTEVKQDPLTLGQHIAAVLAHPDTPAEVYNGIVDGLNGLQRREVSDSAPFIQVLIDGYNLEEKKGTFKKPEGGAA